MASKIVALDLPDAPAVHQDFSLKQIQRGLCDKLGNKILEIMWLSPHYAIYRTAPGIFIHFSDDKKREEDQRAAFATICPELCELRVLTSGMRARKWRAPGSLLPRAFQRGPDEFDQSLFDHNIAQSLMLLMEGHNQEARDIATAALDMAVARTTNDNTVRYLRWAISWAAGIIAVIGLFYFLLDHIEIEGIAEHSPLFLLSAFYGVVGACFSIITRVQSFEMKPCQQSNMNKWMALIRVMIGLIGGFSFYLLATSSLGSVVVNAKTIAGWQGAALLGFMGGFAERMVQTVFQRAATGLESATGTPVQRARVKSGV